jgi:hypothetical protein
MPINNDRIRANGWRQGQLFTIEDTAKITGAKSETSRLLIVSHDCDIVHSGNQQPHIEMFLAEKLPDGVNGQFCWARHPRTLDFEVEENGSIEAYRICASGQVSDQRELLEAYKPDPLINLPESEVLKLVTWLAKRYSRTALPDTLNNRIAPAQKKVRKALQRDGATLARLMIAIKPGGECAPNESYEIYLLGIMCKADHDVEKDRETVINLVNKVAEPLDECEGIKVVDADVLSETEFSLHDERNFIESNFDDLSLRSKAP